MSALNRPPVYVPTPVDPRNAKHYQAFMGKAVKNMWQLVNLVATQRDTGDPLTQENYESKLQGGDPCELLRNMRRDFEGLARRVNNNDFRDEWKEEMAEASAVWQTWHEPNDDYSWLEPQAEFTVALQQFHKRWSDGTNWRVYHATGLRDGVQVNMPNERLTTVGLAMGNKMHVQTLLYRMKKINI
jgi:hypothetical protein